MMRNHAKKKWKSSRALVVFSLLFFAVGCGMDASDAAGDIIRPDERSAEIRDAQTRIFEHDIPGARESYREALAREPEDSEARAGVAVTSFLLLPYEPAVSDLLTACLGADRGLNEDREFIYSDDGLLYLLSLGVPFEDSDGNPGIKTLLAEDLPWSSAKLDSSDVFFAGLDRDMNEIFDKLQGVALALKPIEEDLATLVSDEDFDSFFVPGEAFHDSDLSLVLGKTEFALARAALGGTRTLIQFIGAYDHPFTPDEAFGPRWDALTPQDNEFVEGWSYTDYVTNFLSQRLFREVRLVKRLGNARSAARTTIDAARDSIQLGLDGQSYELGWDQANDSVAREIDDLLVAFKNSFDGLEPVPYTTPAVDMDLSSFFEAPGRTLPDQYDWLERKVEVDEIEDFVSWDFKDAAVETFFISGVFTPEFAVDESPEVRFSGDQEAFSDSLFGELQDDVEDAYFSGR